MNAGAVGGACPAGRDDRELIDDAVHAACADIGSDDVQDVTIALSVEIGSARVSISKLLELCEGSVVDLQDVDVEWLARVACDGFDICVGGTRMAHGELVVGNDGYGIQLTDIGGVAQCVNKLR